MYEMIHLVHRRCAFWTFGSKSIIIKKINGFFFFFVYGNEPPRKKLWMGNETSSVLIVLAHLGSCTNILLLKVTMLVNSRFVNLIHC